MGFRTTTQIDTIVENSKANMHQKFESNGVFVENGLLDPLDNWVRQSNLLYVGDSLFANYTQRNGAVDELERLLLTQKKQDGVFENSLFDSEVWQ